MFRKSLIVASLVTMIVVLAFGPVFAASPFKVSSTTPADGAVDVPLNSDVTIVWNRNVDCGTVNTGNITISPGGWALSSCGGNQAVFTTSGQAPATTYALNVSTAVADTGGTAMKNAYAMSYTSETSDTTGPVVTSTTPPDGATGVLLDGMVTINWDEDIECATVSAASVTSNSPGWTFSSCVFGRANFTTAGQAKDTLYSVTVNASITDLAGNPMTAPYSFSYTTEVDVLIDADTLDGIDSTGFAAAAHAHAQSDVTGLVTALSDLQAAVSALQAENAARQSEIAALQTDNAYLVDLLQHFSRTGSDVVISGANLNIVSGVGTTDGPVNGLGNLVVGYNEYRYPGIENIRTGSHNLILGKENNYAGHGGIVTGLKNEIRDANCTVIGGLLNQATEYGTTVIGGAYNLTGGVYSAAVGGANNIVNGTYAGALGGANNEVPGYGATVTGGTSNRADGNESTVTGGHQNVASGGSASISGGANHTVIGQFDWAAGLLFEDQ